MTTASMLLTVDCSLMHCLQYGGYCCMLPVCTIDSTRQQHGAPAASRAASDMRDGGFSSDHSDETPAHVAVAHIVAQ
eukprot:3961-Heterococcus_DN1.PRE.3